MDLICKMLLRCVFSAPHHLCSFFLSSDIWWIAVADICFCNLIQCLKYDLRGIGLKAAAGLVTALEKGWNKNKVEERLQRSSLKKGHNIYSSIILCTFVQVWPEGILWTREGGGESSERRWKGVATWGCKRGPYISLNLWSCFVHPITSPCVPQEGKMSLFCPCTTALMSAAGFTPYFSVDVWKQCRF